MAEGSDTALTTDRTDVPAVLVDAIKSFAAEHNGAKAVVEYVGKRGARIVLVGQDGVWGDQFAGGTDVARRACDQAGVHVEKQWERGLVEQMEPSDDLWRSMARHSYAR